MTVSLNLITLNGFNKIHFFSSVTTTSTSGVPLCIWCVSQCSWNWILELSLPEFVRQSGFVSTSVQLKFETNSVCKIKSFKIWKKKLCNYVLKVHLNQCELQAYFLWDTLIYFNFLFWKNLKHVVNRTNVMNFCVPIPQFLHFYHLDVVALSDPTQPPTTFFPLELFNASISQCIISSVNTWNYF